MVLLVGVGGGGGRVGGWDLLSEFDERIVKQLTYKVYGKNSNPLTITAIAVLCFQQVG